MRGPARSRGITLVELIVTIVVVGIAVASVLAVLSAAAVRSADTMVRQQSVLIAQSYLREILEKPFGVDACYPGCSRTQMAAVGDYNGLSNTGVRDANDVAVGSLSGYQANVTASYSALGAISAASRQAQLVTVTVTPPTGPQVVISGYRTKYP
jgi:MSHA pilin protein MshD